MRIKVFCDRNFHYAFLYILMLNLLYILMLNFRWVIFLKIFLDVNQYKTGIKKCSNAMLYNIINNVILKGVSPVSTKRKLCRLKITKSRVSTLNIWVY